MPNCLTDLNKCPLGGHINHPKGRMKTLTSSLLSLSIIILLAAIILNQPQQQYTYAHQQQQHQQAATTTDHSKSHLVKVTTTIMIENDGNTPITSHLIDCDERNGHSRLSHIVAKLSNEPMPVTKTNDGKMWLIDLSKKPIESGVTIPLMVTKVYTHLELVPAHDIYLMPHSSIQYQVRIIKQGRPQKVKVPSEQYYLVVDNPELVDLDESTSTALALESEGTTKIRFVDKSVISDEDFIQPESMIHIVNPNYMTMHIRPGESWALRRLTDYIVEIRIYDENKNQIFPSENLNIELNPGNEILVTNSTANGTYHTIHTLNTGPSRLTARLIGTTTASSPFVFDQPTYDIEHTQDLHIYEPLDVRPTAVVLPWLPDIKPSYQALIFAAGGTGSYIWSTNNSALTDIAYGGDDSSVAKITTSGEGTAFIQCIDAKSSVFLRHSIITVTRIVELSILPSITETELGGDVLLPVAVYANMTSLLKLHLPEDERDSDLVLFQDCSKIKFDVEIVEKTRFEYESVEFIPGMRPKSCTSLRFTCQQPGSTRIWISYSDPTDPASKPIKTTTVIACYKPLKPVYPAEVGVLALHTSVEVAFEGGPRPFGSRPDEHYATLEPKNDPVLTIEPVIDRYRYNKDLHVFKAHCNEYGEVLLTLNVGNQPSAILPNPATAKTSVKVVCAKPDSLQVRPRLKETCPLNELGSLIDTLVPISTSTPTDFEIIVFDEAKRQFLNISSFSIIWALNGHGTIQTPRLIEEVNAVAGFRRTTRNYITIQPNGREGLGRLQVDLKSYKNQGLYKGQTLDLTSNLDIQFVEFAQISPNKTVLYNHRKNVIVLSILKGSGYFSVEALQGAKHANVSYVSVFGHHRINIIPLSIGKFVVRLEDQCLESNLGAPILSDVSIVSDTDFSREAARPGRSMRYCRDIDDSMFCLYLSVDPHVSQTTTTRTPVLAPPPPAVKTTPVPVTQKPKVPLPPNNNNQQPSRQQQQRQTVAPSSRPALVEPVNLQQQQQAMESKINFESTSVSVGTGLITSILHRVMGYIMVLFVTASALTLGYKWWQSQNKRRPNPQFVTDSSFLSHSPGASSSGRGSVRFSPSTSRNGPSSSGSGGPTSSTPRTRQLYTERFSTTLLTD